MALLKCVLSADVELNYFAQLLYTFIHQFK